MSNRSLLVMALLVSPMVLAATKVEAVSPRKLRCVSATARHSVRACSLHDHSHNILPGIVYSRRGGGCVRTFSNGMTQVWRPATSHFEFRKICSPDRFRTVTRFRTVFRCGVPSRRSYQQRIRIPGRARRVSHRVHVAGAWVFQKPGCGLPGVGPFH
jgi:hypothetical protein